jgi:lysophospholipase L1-like esterase
LYEALLGENYRIDLVGGERDGEGVGGFDPDHEAHLDWTAAELAWGRNPDGSEGVFAWLEAEPADLVLVHAGSYGLTSSVDQVSAMLDEIDRWEASANGNPVTVVVARIIDREPSDQNISLFNTNLEAMILERASNPAHPSYPDDVLVADLHGALSYPQDLSDDMHPSTQGYGKMAETWKKALTDNALLVKCP